MAPEKAKVARGPARPTAEQQNKPEEEDVASAPAAPTKPQQVAPMDFLNKQQRVSWDQLKDNLAHAQWKEEGVPGAKGFEYYATKLEKTRQDRLKQQEEDTKKMLKAANKSKGSKKKKKDKKEKKGPKSTPEGAVLAGSSDDSSEEDCVLARYKKMQ